MNPIVKILILADFFIFFGLGLIQPILAVFVKEELEGGTLAAGGRAATIYLVARFADREPAKRREFWLLVAGYFLIALTPFLYYFVTQVSHLYLVQLVFGIGAALSWPGWMAIFAKFADHEHAAFSWSLHSTTILLAMAVAATLGGVAGEIYGFYTLFIVVGIITFLGFFTTLGLGLFYDELGLVDPKIGRSFRERLVKVVLRHKHPPMPPTTPPGQLPPK